MTQSLHLYRLPHGRRVTSREARGGDEEAEDTHTIVTGAKTYTLPSTTHEEARGERQGEKHADYNMESKERTRRDKKHA